ncbi:zincin [Marasmius fiardii PR-910]|nr:zincin [Marasmius fiardii PR-910]
MLTIDAVLLHLRGSLSPCPSLVPPSTTSDVSNFKVVTAITNTGDETLRLLNNPESVHFRYGHEYVAKSDDESKFTVLAPRESVEVSHEVGKFYNFTAGAGPYTFKPSNVFYAVEADKSLTAVVASREPAAVSELTGQLSSTKPLSDASTGGVSVPSNGTKLKKHRRSTNDDAIKAAATLAKNSVEYLVHCKRLGMARSIWRGMIIRRMLSRYILETAPADWTYDCSCTDTDVYAQNYGEVYLCGLYWDVATTGSGSRADTIIHEGTHFPKVLGTEDVTYGETNCKELARRDPAQAANNADNHAFFSDYA